MRPVKVNGIPDLSTEHRVCVEHSQWRSGIGTTSRLGNTHGRGRREWLFKRRCMHAIRPPKGVAKWLARECVFRYRSAMSKVLEIEAALRQLPAQEKWEVARWLLDALEERSGHATNQRQGSGIPVLPDYGARRRRIFGDKVLPNMVLVSRSEERW